MKRTILPFLLLACISSHAQNIHSTEASTSFAGPEPPTNLQATVSGNDVHLSWFAPGGGGTQEELIYDNNEYTGSYSFLGYTMSTHMSPSEPCQVLSIKYYTTNNGNQKEFQTKIYNWNGSQPGTTLLYSKNENSVNDGWVEFDVSGEGIFPEGDFVVGFGSILDSVYLAYDINLNNGRSWDLYGVTQEWTTWEEAYLIRAVVLYPSGKTEELGLKVPDVVKKGHALSMRKQTLHHSSGNRLLPNQFERLTGLLGYSVYRDGTLLNASPVSNTWYDDNGLEPGTYSYTVRAVYDEGLSEPAGPVEVTITGGGLIPPSNLGGYVSGDEVNLWWVSPGGGTEEELIYDNNQVSDAYKFPGVSMSTHMSPAESCQILTIKYFTTREGANDTFQARIFNWDGSQPGTYDFLNQTAQVIDNEWVEIDVEPEGLYFNGDFVVGFGSTTEDAYLGYDADFDNGRSWDLDENTGTWSSWNEAYMIRAVVRYGDGTTDELAFSVPPHKINAPAHAEIIPRLHASDYGNISAEPIQNQLYNLTGILGYNLYRNGDKINTEIISSTNATDILPGYGDYDYNVTAVYDEGESAFSPTATFAYYFGIAEINKNAPKIFPNPAHAQIFFSSSEKIMRVRLYGMDGSIHYDDQLFRNGHRIDVEHLPSGMYLIEIKTDNGTHSSKVVIR